MACIITYKNNKYSQQEFEKYFKNNFNEFFNEFLSQDIEGFKEFVNEPVFDKELAQKIQDKLEKLYPEIKLNITNNPVWEQGDNVFNQEEFNNQVNYRLKATEILLSDKAKQVFDKGNKNNWSLDKILTELAIPKEQKELLLKLSATEKITKEVATTKHGTDEYRFSIGEFNKNKNSVRVVKNIEGDFSIHEGDLDELSKSQKVALFKAQSNVIQIGGQIVQRGGSSFDGIRHRINLQNHGFSIQYATDNLQEYKSNDINAVQEFANKYGLGKVIEKDGKLFTKGVILTKEKNDNINLREQLALELASKYSYSVEVNTATEKKELGQQPQPFEVTGVEPSFTLNNDVYKMRSDVEFDEDGPSNITTFYKNNKQISDKEFIKAKDEAAKQGVPTQYYSNLTVPGGTNYTENEIATPGITPSIKGHAQFATDKGIGWFRSDDKTDDSEKAELERIAKELDADISDITPYGKTTNATKTRRILEVQSDWGQKQRKSSEPDINIKYDIQQIINDLQKSGDLKIDCN